MATGEPTAASTNQPTPTPTTQPTPAQTAAPSPTPEPTPTPSAAESTCPPPEPAAPAPPTTQRRASPAAHPGPPIRGGTLRLWKANADQGLDPGIYHLDNREVIYSTFTQPYTYQPTKDLFAMDGMVGYEQVDPLTFVWSLRPGMKFHNGDPVDSEAVAFSFGRLAMLAQVMGGTQVSSAGFQPVERFHAPDDLTVTEHWLEPNADIPIHRARHYYSFVNPRVVQEHGELAGTRSLRDGSSEDVLSVQDVPFGSGSGPYTLVRRDGGGTRVERWPDYHRHAPADDGFVENGPYITAWDTRIIQDRSAVKSAFLRGELDVFGEVEPHELPEFQSVDHVTVVEPPNAGFSGMGMDGGKFHDARSRMALQKAIDYNRFIRELLPGGAELAGPVSGVLPAFQGLSQEDLATWCRYDPQEARALWEAADFVVPLERIRILDQSNRPMQRQISDFMARSLATALCVETQVESLDSNTWAQRATERDGEVKDWELLSYSWAGRGTTGLPYDTHLTQYDPSGYGYFAFNHHAGSPRPEVARDAYTLSVMLQEQRWETDRDARAGLLTEIQRWILDRHWCNWALPINKASYYALNSRLQDFGADDWLNFYGLRRESMWLADARGEGS